MITTKKLTAQEQVDKKIKKYNYINPNIVRIGIFLLIVGILFAGRITNKEVYTLDITECAKCK